MQKLLLLFLLLAVTASFSVKDNFVSIENQDLNPPDSELTLFMRAMFEHTQKVRAQVKKGKNPALDFEYARLNTSKASFPEKIARPEYRTYVMDYLTAVNKLNTSEKKDLLSNYRKVISACITCHEKICPGPISRIKQLEL